MANRRAKTKTRSDPKGTSGRSEAVRLRLLGGFQVSVGARTIEEDAWRLRKAASLVKLLALASGHRLHREQAMDALWPDLGMRAASNNLRQTLHAARRTLDPAAGSRYLASQDELLVLCPEGSLWVDVEAFEEAAETARRSREPAAYRAALDLYAGELLPTDRYEEWAEEHRRRLRETYLSLLLGLAGLHEERADYYSAAEALRRVLSEEPTREEAHTGLMRLYALLGSKGEALAQYGRLEEALARQLGTEPAATSRTLCEEIAAGRFPSEKTRLLGSPPEETPGAGWHNLPASRTSFVGREQEMVEVKRELAMTRLLTLTGAGGAGKTRLALEVARDLVGAYPDGAWLVELAGLTEGALVPQAVAGALEVKERPGEPLTDTLVEALRGKQMLLILDNCEHLVDAAARLVDVLLNSCPRLQVLATSREALVVAGETVWPVSALSVPDPRRSSTVGELERSEAARLFAERARQRNLAFVLSPQNARAVAEICRRLEGMPLAIELAAARVGTLAVEQIVERLEDSLKLLTVGGRTAVPKQQTLKGALDWSHKLLDELERKLFRRLSVFAGGWTLEAAEAVASGGGVEEGDVLDLLSGLVDKSLVVPETTEQGGVRYRLLEPIRQYALEKLEESGEAEPLRRRHAAYFLTLAQEAEAALGGPQQSDWLARLEREHANLGAALSWSLESGSETALRLAGTLARFWEMRSRYSEGSRWLEAALRRSDRADAAARAKALTEAGTFAWHRGDYEHATALHAEALALYRELGDGRGVGFALNCLGVQELEKGNYDRAAPLFEEALVFSRRFGDGRTVGYALLNLGEVARHRGEYGRAVALGTESLSLFREMADEWHVARILVWLGMVTVYKSDDHEAAAEFLREGLALIRKIGDRERTAFCLEGLAGLAAAKAQGARAARLWGAAEALRETIGAPLPPVDRPDYDHSVAAARSQVDEASWEAAFAEGKAMTLEEAVEYALSEEEPGPPASPATEQPSVGVQPPSLTRREEEVAALVARGLTNRQIAEELVISERTVHHHVTSILKKLNLRSRQQLAARLNKQQPHRPGPS